MAYSNWGGLVYCNDHALHGHCDATPRQVLGLQSDYIHYLQHYVEKRDKENGDLLAQMYHAVVGDEKAGVLVCLRKSYISAVILFDSNGQPDFAPHPRGWTEDYAPDSGTFQAGNITVEYNTDDAPECVEVSFTDALGRQWRGTSGYCMGEGFEDWG